MPRTITSTLDATLATRVTRPRFILEMLYTTPMRLYTGWPTDTTKFSRTWKAGGFELISYEQNRNGSQKARVRVTYSQDVLGTAIYESAFLTEGFDGQVSSLYYIDPVSRSTEDLIIDGYVDDGRIEPNGVSATVDIVGKISSRLRLPRTRFTSPAWTRLVVPGTVVNWKRDKYTIERDR